MDKCICNNDCKCNLEGKLSEFEDKLNSYEEAPITNYVLNYPFFNIKCICCDKLYIESGDYKSPLYTENIQHSHWYHKYVKGKSIWICRTCFNPDIKKYITDSE